MNIAVIAPPEWTVHALCAQTDPDAFYPEIGQPARPAKAVCRRCFVRTQCLTYALERNERWGVWGGLTVNERDLLRQGRAA